MNKKPCYMWTQESKVKLVNCESNLLLTIKNNRENASNLCQYIMDTTPGLTFDVISEFIAERIVSLYNNPYADKERLKDTQHISNHVRIAIIELAQEFNK